MKLQTKQREGSKLRRTYDQAQTPMQRLLASGILPSNKQQELLAITAALDPLRLLQQLEQLQKALWRHAVMPEAAASQQSSATLPFSVNQCAQGKIPVDGMAGSPHRCLNRSAEDGNIKKVGGLMTGARGRIRLRASGRRSLPGLLPDRNSPRPRSSVSWNVSTRDAIAPLRLAPYDEAFRSCGRVCW
jgi:hypothetical protein